MIPGTQIESAARQRETFDRAFTLPVREPAELQPLVLLQVAGQAYALSLERVVSIEHDRSVITAPSRVVALVGLSTIGGAVVPVFSLASLLTGNAAPMSDDWFRAPLLAVLETADAGDIEAAQQRVGVAFERPLLFVRVEQDAFHQTSNDKAVQTVEHEDILYTVLRASTLLDRIMRPHGTPTGTNGDLRTR